MTQPFTQSDLIAFLDFLADKGLVKRGTVVSRKAAVNTLLSVLDETEANDLSKLDVDDLLQRFGNLKGQEFKPASLQVYKSRLNSVLIDYKRWKANPAGYKHVGQTKERGSKSERPINSMGDNKQPETQLPPEDARQKPQLEKVEEITFPIPIRRGLIVRVTGIPSDLTPEEATKIGNVILALSGSQEEAD